VTGGGLQLYIR